MAPTFPINNGRMIDLLSPRAVSVSPGAILVLLDLKSGSYCITYPTDKAGEMLPEPTSWSGFTRFEVEGLLVGWTNVESPSVELTQQIESAYKIHFLEQKINDASVLSKIAQGINITLRFDDTLELIYAQTSRLIPNRDFRVLLVEDRTEQLYYDFFISGDERVTDKEKSYLIEPPQCEIAIIQSRTARAEINYVNSAVLSFIGAPLNAGSHTIGALCLYAKDLESGFTARHKELLQTIADHTAGAIYKERLLVESTKRAQQFAKLNEVGRVLTSTLEVDKLLSTVLESVVGYMDATDGNISLIDSSSGELVIKASTSPNLIQDPTLNSEHGKFNLTVPLVVKNEVIGALELFGRKNGKLFSEEDQNLLSAFASQAAIALENARLYTLTDQSLALRVEELSVMQRIDQELNSQLDLSSAARTTLRWALAYSELAYGFIGLWEDEELTILHNVTQNYEPTELSTFIKHHGNDFATDVISFSSKVNQSNEIAFLFPTSELRFIVPILRESIPIGLIYLEGKAPLFKKTEELSAFLKRLSDHATTALTNGQLLKQLSDSNNAKSEFVSLVAHELRNPMTSIKGYSDLIAAGAAGPLTETQSSFLEIVRNNVNRMKTIVEDLNDITKIEAGKLRLDFNKVSASDLLNAAIHSTNKQFSEKNQTISSITVDDLPMLWVDKTRSEQILVNLLMNANKYTEEGGAVSVFTDAIVENGIKFVRFSVSDNGIGISIEDQAKIFTKFFRSEDDRARKSSGTGLGLNISKNLVELQGGKMWFESEFGKGSTFFFTLPALIS